MSSGNVSIVKNTLKQGYKDKVAEYKARALLGIERGMQVIRAATLPFVPEVTGRLVGSYGGIAEFSQDAIFKTESKRNEIAGYVGSKVPYARRIEFGFKGEDKLGRSFEQKAQYPLTQGLEKGKGDVQKVIINTLKTGK
jgi:hypothetical protein